MQNLSQHLSDVMSRRLGFASNDAGQNQCEENEPDYCANDLEFHVPPPEPFRLDGGSREGVRNPGGFFVVYFSSMGI